MNLRMTLLMSDADVIDIATQTMIVAAKVAAPILLTALAGRVRDLAVPGGDPDPGTDLVVRAEDDRRRRSLSW